MVDLNALSIKELKSLLNDVSKAIADFDDRKKREALVELDAKARELGFALNDLVGLSVKRKRAPVSLKYANPANSSQAWSGRGRKPLWFTAALAGGKTPDDLKI